jgi:hypothetical protein
MSSKLALALASLLTVAFTLPTKRAATFGDKYVYYTGDGSIAAGWPARSSWGTYAEIWDANLPLMQQSCGWNGWGADDSTAEINNINSAIQALAVSATVDSRFILAIMMQESKGCVRVHTTGNGVVNPGLMQSHDGAGTCAGVNPCPASEITQMIKDGVAGTSSGNGLTQLLAQTKAALDQYDGQPRHFYAAARLYNSGSIDYSNLDDGLGSTACYVSDIANRLMGWTLAASTCTA